MSSKEKTWERLRNESWCINTPSLARKNDVTARFQRLSEGVGSYYYDEYAVIINSFPQNISPEKYLMEFAMAPNKAVSNNTFNLVNKFTKRNINRLEIGDIWDIDILGHDNGSIVLVALSDGLGKKTGSSWFDIQTIECDKYGTHPECGAREFGFEVLSEGVKYYTRGVSRSYMQFHRLGTPIQRSSWISMMEGILSTFVRRGAVITNKSITEEKLKK